MDKFSKLTLLNFGLMFVVFGMLALDSITNKVYHLGLLSWIVIAGQVFVAIYVILEYRKERRSCEFV